MEGKKKDEIKDYGDLNVTYKHPDYVEQKLVLKEFGHFSKDGEFFYILPKRRHLDGHDYYMSIKVRWGLEVNKTYTLSESRELIHAHLEFDNIDGDRITNGTFRLTRSGQNPQGIFDIVDEGVFSAVGEFDFQEIRK